MWICQDLTLNILALEHFLLNYHPERLWWEKVKCTEFICKMLLRAQKLTSYCEFCQEPKVAHDLQTQHSHLPLTHFSSASQLTLSLKGLNSISLPSFSS